jgi:two-component system sensor histidine kinase BaeS
MADPDRAAQVLSNLVDNALLYAPRGSQILLAASLTSGMIQLQVTDQGPGIQPEDLPLIFDRFYRTDSSRRRDTGSSGLGLAIARSLAEAQGGKLWATSTPGQGASFHFSLPRADTPV